MQILRWFAFGCGAAIVVVSALSLVVSLVVPRRLASRLPMAIQSGVRRSFLWFSARFDSYDAKDRILAFEAPIALLTTMTAWLFFFFAGFTLMLWPFTGSLGVAARESGSSLLTLGFASGDGFWQTALYFFGATSGLVVIALLIAYLPALYAAFNRRETLVMMLQSRAGAPAWGVEVLLRHQFVGLMNNLPQFYTAWEQWAADVAESHTNYAILARFRSPHPLRSWIIGLLAVMDSAALHLSLCPKTAPTEARLCLRMGFTCLRDVAEAVGIPFDPDPFPEDPIELTYEEFAGAVQKLEDAGFPVERSAEEAWPHFRGWRVNYESVAYAIANWVVAPPGPWSGERDHLPGMSILPQRPTDRAPGSRAAREIPKHERGTWRV